jgi:EamA-like transporter family
MATHAQVQYTTTPLSTPAPRRSASSTVTYLIPLVAVVLGALVLDEPVTWNLLVGAAIILVGVAVSEDRLGLGRQWRPGPRESGPERAIKVPGRH